MKYMQIGAAFLLSAINGLVYGYKYDFTNTMRGPIVVRVKLSGINEPFYYAVLQGKNARLGRSYTFNFEYKGLLALSAKAARVVPKSKTMIERAVQNKTYEYVGRKTGFCLSQIQVAPFEWDKDAKIWRMTDEYYDLAPYFVETNYFHKMLNAAGAAADGAFQAAGDIVKSIGEAAAIAK